MDSKLKPNASFFAGILLIVAGIFPILLYFDIFSTGYAHIGGYTFCISIALVLGIISIISGILAIKSDNWQFLLLGGVAAILTLIIQSIVLGIISMILAYFALKEDL